MSRVFSVLCSLLVLCVISEAAFGHGRYGHHHGRHGHGRHGHGRHHHWPRFVVNLSMYEPKGLEVAIPRPNSTAQYAAVQMTINNPNGSTPDVLLNTTDLVYGKFILRDTEVILMPGDFLNATYEVGYSNGGVIRHYSKIIVSRDMMQRNCSCDAEPPKDSITARPIVSVPPWLRTTTASTPPRVVRTSTVRSTTTTEETTGAWNEEQMDYSSELFDCEIDPETNRCMSHSMIDERFSDIDQQPRAAKLIVKDSRHPDLTTLKNVFEMVNGQCVSKPRTSFLTLKSPNRPFESSDELVAYVRGILKQSPKLTELADKGLRSARPHGKVIVFEMNTLINKLQLLYLAQESGLTVVKDFD